MMERAGENGKRLTTDYTDEHGWLSILIVILILIEKSTIWEKN